MRTSWMVAGVLALASAAPASGAAPGGSDAAGAPGQQDVLVELRVLTVLPGAGDAVVVRVDQGTAAGLRPGDRVTLRPLGLAPLQGTVLEADPREATVDVPQRGADVAPGVPGEVRVPRERLEDEGAELPAGAEGRPPIRWSSEEAEWAEDAPLLAEAKVLDREEREPAWRGRTYLSTDLIRDRVGAGRDDLFLRLGVDARGTNLFGYGGELRLDGELNLRDTEVADGQGESETLGRVDRLSYALGGVRGRPTRVEVGRFLPSEFPELGLLDGVEVSHRTAAGHRYGGSLGFLPSFDRQRSTGETLQAATWASFALDPDEHMRLGAAYQRTWHKGDADRELLLARLRWYPGGAWSASATAWVDVYGAEDTPKDEGPELTQVFANVSRRFGSEGGLTLSGSRVRYPAVLRGGLQDLPAEILQDGRADRVTLSGWKRLGETQRLSARVDRWSDQEADGLGGELGWQKRLGAGVLDRVDVAAFLRTGRTTDVVGVRTGTGGPLAGGRWRAHLDVGLYEQLGFSGDQEELLQNALLLGWDGSLADGWALSLNGAYRFGDEQDAVSLGFLLQRSF